METSRVRAALLRWYDGAARELPWRRSRDPYAIWVSEVMLQQTRVDTAIPYFARFLALFPTPAALAAASEDEVLGAWSGLGYYRRARLLHAGARVVVERHGGHVPEDAEARRALPGVGAYTCGAIGSIAFDREEPLVDGNVARVLARLTRIETPLGQRDTERALWAHADALVRGPRPGALNQALMELGAMVCTPQKPACATCPVRDACAARAAGCESALPVPRAKKAPTPVRLVAVAARTASDADARVFVRGRDALFGGLHGLPMHEGEGRDAAKEALRTAGVTARLEGAKAGEVVHVLTHRRLFVEVWRATSARLRDGAEDARALRPEALAEVGVATLTKKLLACADDPQGALF